MMSWLQSILMKLYGTSEEQEDEQTRATAQAVLERAAQRERELGQRADGYSQSVMDAYTRRDQQ